jgi:glycosyltransferase involved in cell wall biosynthesis
MQDQFFTMKILHLVYTKQVAGAERYLLSLLPGLKNSGMDCSLICITPTADAYKFTGFCEELNQKGVETILMTGAGFNLFFLARRINRYLRANNIRFLHAHLFKADLLAVVVKKFFNPKLFLLSTKHGYQEKYLSNYHVNKGKVSRDVYYYIARTICRNTDAQFTISRAMSDLYFDLKLTRERMHFIYHGISVSPPGDTHLKINREQDWGRLVIVGRLEPIKGHQYLFRAMPAVMEKFPQIRLQVIGNGTQKDLLRELAVEVGAEKNIEFLGFQEDTYYYMSSADVIVLPSLFEPFGLVYLEAFALQVPIIAFDVPATNEIVVNKESGLLVPVYDSAALAKMIIFLLENREERERLARNGYRRFREYYNTERMINDTIDWYRKVLSD